MLNLITTTLVGKEATDILADFEFNEDGTRIIKCVTGHESLRISTFYFFIYKTPVFLTPIPN